MEKNFLCPLFSLLMQLEDLEPSLIISEIGNAYKLVEDFVLRNPLSKDKKTLESLRKRIEELNEIKEDRAQVKNSVEKLLKKFQQIIKKEVIPEIYFMVGLHGGVIIDNHGYCEFDSPEFAMKRVNEKLKSAISLNFPYNVEIATSTLEWVNEHHPESTRQFVDLLTSGPFNFINNTYSQPYLLTVQPESNIKEFEFGLRACKKMNIPIVAYYGSEASVHPQLPQILRGFGIEKCSLRVRLLGVAPTTTTGHIRWVGTDGTEIQCVTDQSGVFNGEIFHGTFFREIPSCLFQAIARPFLRYIVYSSIEDCVMPLPSFDAVALSSAISESSGQGTIFGNFVNIEKLMNAIPVDGKHSFSLDLFDLGWYIFQSQELYALAKKNEYLLLALELLHTCSNIDLRKEIDELWKYLLLTHAHDCYAVPNTKPGDYSYSQLDAETLKSVTILGSRTSIREICLNVHNKIINKIYELSYRLIFGKNTQNKEINQFPFKIVIFNPCQYAKNEIIEIQTNDDIMNIIKQNIDEIMIKRDDKEVSFYLCEKENTILIPLEMNPFELSGLEVIRSKSVNSIKSKENNKHKYISVVDNALEIKSMDTESLCLSFDQKKEDPSKISIETTAESEFHFETDISIRNSKELQCKINILINKRTGKLKIKFKNSSLKDFGFNLPNKIIKIYRDFPFGIECTTRNQFFSLNSIAILTDNAVLQLIHNNFPEFRFEEVKNKITIKLYKEFTSEINLVKYNQFTQESMQYNTMKSINPILYFISDEPVSIDSSFLQNIKIPNGLVISNIWRNGPKKYLRAYNISDEKIELNACNWRECNLLLENIKIENIENVETKEKAIARKKIATFEI
jgi:hypothetical protein